MSGLKGKELKFWLIEICRNIEFLAHDCAEHLAEQHGIKYAQYPYFENIEKQIRELIESLENKPEKRRRKREHEAPE
jgi:hypothetical protein